MCDACRKWLIRFHATGSNLFTVDRKSEKAETSVVEVELHGKSNSFPIQKGL